MGTSAVMCPIFWRQRHFGAMFQDVQVIISCRSHAGPFRDSPTGLSRDVDDRRISSRIDPRSSAAAARFHSYIEYTTREVKFIIGLYTEPHGDGRQAPEVSV